ncbi:MULTISPECIES: TetR/AcrR family transcriptional regulator [Streptomyces]|uniref:TetR/AcrR family transcriptional regulator n=1 Tax=Streptomyces glycanivorans TaxID=3033808 RepID=A0ABY9JHR6_9ACTN|nr:MULTISPECIES: TetR/AcrR family transcriptional regulator [unclassified Streptomyces]WLQ67262.1 TetR/AcrR family transcriptional regulator [Streptomyces sp. Alt3]WSQ88016.1 TetR/AcrR family transcriptional regulator [Streptomyces sp. NBC_01212]WSR05976.1 TetR/AcrR family transcriptional regulator [Streptomyces sp. NBC_01208]WSR51416.1 TetR/AcrR family transcriptional regulator [Streptomyces sp. NBC_01201]
MEHTGTADAAPKRARVRNRRGEGGRLREDIVAAAMELLDETGDERTITLRSVARRVGIAAPSIYPHFPDQPAIMLAVVRQEFDGLTDSLRTSVEKAGDDPRRRLYAVCNAYLDYARLHPGRYRTMFGGLWLPDLGDSSLTEQDLATLGAESMQILVDALGGCVGAGQATSDDVPADAVALWVGLHGLAHQRTISRAFPWPEDISDRVITALAHLNPADG